MSHISSKGLYVRIFVSLLILTALTVWVAGRDFGVLNTPIAMAIAITKGTLVVLFFMGVKYNTPLTKAVALSGFIWLFILFGVTLTDYVSRTWVGAPGR